LSGNEFVQNAGGDSSPSIPLPPSRIRLPAMLRIALQAGEDSASCDAGISEPDLPCFCEPLDKLGEPNLTHADIGRTQRTPEI